MEKTKKHDDISSNAMHSTPRRHSTNHAMRIFYALAIVFVVAGHSSLYYPSGLNLGYNLFPVYSFHMPMFIFAAGYFYNPKHERHPVRFALGKVRRLLVPMFAIHAFVGWFVTFLASHGFSSYDGIKLTWENVFLAPFSHDNMHMFSFDLAMWFLIPMFLAQCAYMTFHALVVHGSGRLHLVLDTVLGAALVAAGVYVIDAFGTGEAQLMVMESDMLRIYQSLVFLAFMAIGYYYHTYIERYLDKVPDAIVLTALLLFQMGLMFTYGTDLTMVICWIGFPAGALGTMLMGMSGTLFWLRVSKILAPRLKGSWLANEIGKNTFSIMAFHFFGFFLLNLIMYVIKKGTGGACLATFAEDVFLRGDIYYKCIPEHMAVTPGASDAWGMLYVMFGVGVPLLLHKAWELASAPVRHVASMAKAVLLGDEGDGETATEAVTDSAGNPDAPTGGDGGSPDTGTVPPRRPKAPRPHRRVATPSVPQVASTRRSGTRRAPTRRAWQGEDYRHDGDADGEPRREATASRQGRVSYRLRHHAASLVRRQGDATESVSYRRRDARGAHKVATDVEPTSTSATRVPREEGRGRADGGAPKGDGGSRPGRTASVARRKSQGLHRGTPEGSGRQEGA